MKKPTQVLVGVMAAVMFIAAIPAKCADVPCDSHAWDDGVIVWNEDFSEAVGVWTCFSCGETETAGAEIFLRREEATCEEEGSVRMSANAVMGSYSCFDSRTVELEPLGHRYSEPQFDWDTDDFDCRASYVCTRDDCDETWIVDCDVTETVYPSKGHAPGGVIYTAYVNIGGTDFADTYQVEGNPIGHEYSTPMFCWSEDCRTAYIESVCSVCESEDPEKTLRADCTVRTYFENADCSSDGFTEYTASAVLLGKTWEEKKTVIIPKMEHAYTDPTFAWDDFGCQAFYECTAGGETFHEVCTITEKKEYSDCTSPGTLIKTAEIEIDGLIYTDTTEESLPSRGHNLTRIPGKEPTCTEDGVMDGMHCLDCGADFPGAILEKHGHAEVTVKGKAPTCTETGLSDKVFCIVCETLLAEQEIIPAVGHTPKTVLGREPTCAKTGLTDGEICSVCKTVLVEQEPIQLKGHTLLLLDARDATCTENGYTAGAICSVCDTILTKQTIIPAKGHEKRSVAGYPATCIEDGITDGCVCTVCEAVLVEQEIIPAKGHTPQKLEAKAVTCTEDGLTEGSICSDCQTVLLEQTAIPAKGHMTKKTEGYAAACTEDGLTDGLICTVCQAVLVKQERIPAQGHIPLKQDRIPATCTKPGYTDGNVCSVCNTVLAEQGVIPAKGHTPTILEGCDATCTEDGYTEGSVCSVCEVVLVEQTIIAATGHVPVKSEAKEATCTEDGCLNGEICSVCKTVLHAQSIIPAKGHKPAIKKGYAPTCTEVGYTDGSICSVCETELVVPTVIPSLGHTPMVQKGSAPTCTESGYTEGSVCSVCETVLFAQTVIPAVGHKPVIQKSIVPTCTEDGYTEGSICSVCETELIAQTVIPATGHTPQTIAEQAPTCTENGYTEGSCCSVCQAVIEEPKVIAAKGHVPIAVEALEPTCTEAGHTAGIVCYVCQDDIVVSAELPALGHMFDEVVFAWNDRHEAISADKTCSVCEIVLHGEVTTKQTTVIENGNTYAVFTATAVFSDETTAAEVKKMLITSGKEPNVPVAPDAPETPVTPNVPTEPEHPNNPGVSEEPTEPLKVQFDDVAIDSYYYNAVAWAAQQKVTQGTAERIFSPDMICSRAQIVTMLWRAVGCPIIGGTTDFADVPQNSYYYKAVLWAAKTRITSGTSKTTFSPDLQCTRAQIVTMLWRTAGCPGVKTVKSFSDVAKDAWYAEAVAWAVQEGITLGTGEGVFSPDAVCTRAQIVTFLYRAQNTRAAQM